MTDKLHLQRWINYLNANEDGSYECKVSYTITQNREESVIIRQSSPLKAARVAFQTAKAHYEDRRDSYYLKRGYEETDVPFRNRGVYEVKHNGHLLAWNRHGWHCQHCDDVSEYLPSSDHLSCPKVKRYRSWEDIPENLKTRNQLYELGYSKGKTKLPDPAGAIAWHDDYGRRAGWRWVFVYPMEKAVKRQVTSAQEKALKKAHRAKGSSLKIIKAVTDILPSDYTVESNYEMNIDEWGKMYYTLKIKLDDLILRDLFLSTNQKKSIQRAKNIAKEILKVNDLWKIVQPLADWNSSDIDIHSSNYDGDVIVFYRAKKANRIADWAHSYESIEVARQMLKADLIRELL